MANLYLIPTTLGDNKIESVIPGDINSIVKTIRYFIVENLRTARRYLKKWILRLILMNLISTS